MLGAQTPSERAETPLSGKEPSVGNAL